jgi:hypothetical protein
VTCDRSVVFSGSTNKTDRHDITEILLKAALNTTKQTNKHKIFRSKKTKGINKNSQNGQRSPIPEGARQRSPIPEGARQRSPIREGAVS